MRQPLQHPSKLVTRPRLARAVTCFFWSFCTFTALALSSPAARAQGTGQVSGVVTGDGGVPLPRVDVLIPALRLGAVTGTDGRYTIPRVPAGTHAVRAQRLGYQPSTQQVAVAPGATATANFQLTAVPTSLEAQVIVGYTTQQRRDVSDAVAGVRAEQIQSQKVATIEEALRGQVPGVQVSASGEPGRPAQIIIRGQNFLGNVSPLYVVDGMYLQENPNLNPDDVESIEVLKDASAAAQYGAQAANGVIVIRTRRGTGGDPRVELHSYYGYQDMPKRIDMMSAQDWGRLASQAYLNAGRPVPAGVAAAAAGTGGVNTNWQDAVFRRGAIMDHNVSVSGGSPMASYLVSGGYLDQRGSIIETSFRRQSVRVNSDMRRGRLTLGENIALAQTNRQGLSGFPLIDVARMLPTIPVYDPNNPSGYGYGSSANPTFGTNPVGLLTSQPREQRSSQVIGSAFAEYGILPSLRYRMNLGLNYDLFARHDFTSIAQLRQGSQPQFATLYEQRNEFTSLLAEQLLMFNNEFRSGAHKLNAVAGYTLQRQTLDVLSASRQGFTDENLRTIDAGQASGLGNSGANIRSALEAYLVRANYTLFDRYLFTGSLRRDGSSRFGPQNRWANFAAASLGWIVSEEAFYRSIPLLNRAGFLKLRVSHGTLGNQDIGDYRYAAPIAQNLNYLFGNNQIASGATQISLANPNIRWQSNRQTNFGLDVGMLDDRLTATLDYYKSTSDGLLVEAPIPWSLGAIGNPVVNAGSVQNKGFELGAAYRMERGDFQLNTSANLTTTRNTVLSLGNGGQPLFDETGAARTAVGGSIGEFYVIRTAGIFQSAAEVQAYTNPSTGKLIQPNAQPGDVRYVDANGDGVINLDDRVSVGNGTPKYSGGIFFDGRYRAWDFGLNLRGAGGFKVFNAVKYWTDRMDDPSNFRTGFAPWSLTNPSTTTPRALATASDNTMFLTDRWIEKGDFLRIQNLIFGYTLPLQLVRGVGLTADTRSRIYVNLQNLHTFTGFSNWDPETLGFGNPLGRGIDDGRIYPNVRTVTIGLDLRL